MPIKKLKKLLIVIIKTWDVPYTNVPIVTTLFLLVTLANLDFALLVVTNINYHV